jgi:hypothetical protein
MMPIWLAILVGLSPVGVVLGGIILGVIIALRGKNGK